MEEKIKKALLEAGRVVVLAILPVAIASLEKGEIDMRYIGIVAALALLRFTDKWLHEIGKENDNGAMIKGITLF